MNRIPIFFAVSLLSMGVAVAEGAVSDTTSSPSDASLLEEILVTGEQPGPALWKVSSDDHILWILGEVSPLPHRVKWRSKRFESLLANSQEVLLEVGDRISADKRQTARLKQLQKLPEGQRLKGVVSPELYEHVETVAGTYRTLEPIEHLRPHFAANRIGMSAMRSMNLMVFSATFAVEKLARDAKVRITYIDTPRQSVDEYIGNIEHGSSVPCLERMVEMLDGGGFGARRLANAWATGAIGELRQLVPAYAWANESHAAGKCMAAIYGGERRANEFVETRLQSWLGTAERALRENHSTMAVVPMVELVAPDGYLAALQAKGYEVVEPD